MNKTMGGNAEGRKACEWVRRIKSMTGSSGRVMGALAARGRSEDEVNGGGLMTKELRKAEGEGGWGGGGGVGGDLCACCS